MSTHSAEGLLRSLPSSDDDLEARHLLAQVRRRLAGVQDTATIGRYHVRERIGEGGMGLVFSGFDPELSRPVALKLMRTPSDRARTRLIREAQALAMLSHPNVIEIYDVLEEGDRVCLAMELIAGTDLQTWLSEPRRAGEVLAVFAAAGRGLLAAHHAGLVHRDFKPANVMLPTDGRVRVLDFGLARYEGGPNPPPSGIEDLLSGTVPLHSTITRPGSHLGTPAFMAPEQLRSDPVGPAADQFAFCVSLHLALTGRRPFEADGVLEYLARVEAGLPERPPQIDAHLWGVLRTGLAADPSARHADLRPILAALERPRRRGWSWGLAAIGLGTVLLGSVVASPSPCPLPTSQAAWLSEDRDRLADAFARSGAHTADLAAGVVAARLDAWSSGFDEARARVCASEPVGHSELACLHHELARGGALVHALFEADEDTVGRAIVAVANLDDPARCTDGRTARALVGPPADPDRAERAAQIRVELQTAWALERTGRYDDALAFADRARKAADALAFEPLQAETRRIEGVVLEHLGRNGEAMEAFTDAHFFAESSGHDDQAARAIADLLFEIGVMRGDIEGASRWYRHAQARLSRDTVDPYVRATVELNYSTVLYVAGRYDEALEKARAARESVRVLLGPDDYRNATCENAIGNVLLAQGDYAGALGHQREALRIQRAALGEEHSAVGDTHMIMAGAYIGLAELERAAEHAERAVEIKRAAHGDASHQHADALINWATVLGKRADHEAARDGFVQALRIYDTLPGDPPFLGACLHNLAIELIALGEREQARSKLERAIRVRSRLEGVDHPDIAPLRAQLEALEAPQKDPPP